MRFERVGNRVAVDQSKSSSPGAGSEKVHVAIDDATRLSYAEVLPDEKVPTTMCLLNRVEVRFTWQGIGCRRVLGDNLSAYKSHGWRKASRAVGLQVKKTRQYAARTNGNA